MAKELVIPQEILDSKLWQDIQKEAKEIQLLHQNLGLPFKFSNEDLLTVYYNRMNRQ